MKILSYRHPAGCRMMRILLSMVPLFLLSIGLTYAQDAAHTISYQGLLQSPTGSPLYGTHSIAVHFFSDPEGTQSIWDDTFRVSLSSGVFDVLLGSHAPLPDAKTLDRSLWIGVQVDNEPVAQPLSPLSASPYALAIADSSVTASKMRTAYVGSISINGQKVTSQGTDLNLIGTNGINLAEDPTTNSIYVSGTGTPGNNGGGKGEQPLGSSAVAGTEYEVLANGTYGVFKSGNVTLTTPQDIAPTSSPSFANLTLSGKAASAPTGSEDPDTTLTTKGYVDNGLSTKLPLAGGTMTGSIAMGSNGITNLADPTNAQDAATKNYVDNSISTATGNNYIKNQTSQQTANFNISGSGTIGNGLNFSSGSSPNDISGSGNTWSVTTGGAGTFSSVTTGTIVEGYAFSGGANPYTIPPNVSTVMLTAGTSTIYLPSETDGKVIHIYNHSGQQTSNSSDVVIPNRSLYTVIGLGGSWVLESNQ